jgi:uncharacterized protein (TIGR02271 family)
MTNATDRTVVAVFNSANEARAAVDDLKSAGFDSDDIYVSSESTQGSEVRGTDASPIRHEHGIKEWFKSLFGTEEHAHQKGYEGAIAGGKTVVSVDASESSFNRASEILESHSPVNIQSDDYGTGQDVDTPNTQNAGYQGSRSDVLNTRQELNRADQPRSAGRPVGRAEDREGQAIPVVQEELQVGKRTVQTGGVRVYSRATTRPVEEQIRLREEHVHVDREPVNRPATEADVRSGRDQVIEIAEYAEEPVVAKQARVVEEVRVRKDASDRVETVRDSVVESGVEVEQLGGGGQQNTSQSYDDADFRRHYAEVNPGSSAKYDDYAPAYRYGYDAANNPNYSNIEYAEAEPRLREEYGSRYPNSTWERMKDSVRYGWDKVRGKARSASAR